MNLWCCHRRERRNSRTDERFQVIRDKLIDDFVSEISAEARRRAADVCGLNFDSMEDDVFAENTNEVTRNFSMMRSRFRGKESKEHSSAQKLDQEENQEDFVVRQRISQVLEMGAYQPGISFANQNSDSESDLEEESGVFMDSSSRRKSSSLVQGYLSSSSGVISNPCPDEVTQKTVNRRFTGCEQGLRKPSLFTLLEQKRSHTLSGDVEGFESISSSEISTNFLDNVC